MLVFQCTYTRVHACLVVQCRPIVSQRQNRPLGVQSGFAFVAFVEHSPSSLPYEKPIEREREALFGFVLEIWRGRARANASQHHPVVKHRENRTQRIGGAVLVPSSSSTVQFLCIVRLMLLALALLACCCCCCCCCWVGGPGFLLAGMVNGSCQRITLLSGESSGYCLQS